MSYILEALKKAQAERQIGSTPTIHAPTLASAQQGQSRSVQRTPMIVALVLMGAAIAGLATMLVRQQPPAAQPRAAAVDASVAAPPAQAGSPAHAAPPAAAAAVQAEIPAPDAASAMAAIAAPAAAAVPEAVAKQPPVAAASSSATAPATVRAVGASAASTARAIEAPAAAPVTAAPAPAPAAPPAPAPLEEHIQSLQDLPEPIQRAIPPIALGGYMYSKNPADRLLLIDKVLRKEGEEVAPGLLLEKLQPKQAVFRFRGYRYKVPL